MAHDALHPTEDHNIGTIVDHIDGYPKIYNYDLVIVGWLAFDLLFKFYKLNYPLFIICK